MVNTVQCKEPDDEYSSKQGTRMMINTVQCKQPDDTVQSKEPDARNHMMNTVQCKEPDKYISMPVTRGEFKAIVAKVDIFG